jgi:hypothetical protein
MVDARRLELLTSAGSTVRVPILGAACMYLPVPSTSSRYVQDGPTTGWKLLGEFGLAAFRLTPRRSQWRQAYA